MRSSILRAMTAAIMACLMARMLPDSFSLQDITEKDMPEKGLWLTVRALAVMGLMLGLLSLPYNSVRKPIWGLTTRMLDGETFERVPMLKIRRSMDHIIASGPSCDVDVLAARAVFDMRFAEELLRDSRGPEFDDIQDDVRRNITELLKCAPRRSFFWDGAVLVRKHSQRV